MGNGPRLRKTAVDTAIRSSEQAFNADDVNHVAEYRSLSVLAIIGLLFGLASPLSILAPVFLMIPLLGAILSLLALRQIVTSEGRLAGRWAAMAGLVLCVACGASAVSRSAVMRSMRIGRAQEFSHAWFEKLVANKPQQAFRMTVIGTRPPPAAEPGAPPPTSTPYEQFTNDPLIKQLVAAGEDAKIEYLGTQEYVAQSDTDYFVRQQYRVTPQKSSDGAKPIDAYLNLARSKYRGDNNMRWLVADFKLAAGAAE